MRGPVQQQILDLPRLIEDVARGSLLVPTCHGPLGWSDAQRLELLRSVRDGLPIGSILVWRTSLRLDVHGRVAGIPVETPRAGPYGYVMDGHQRLAALFGALRRADGPTADGYGGALDWRFSFDAGLGDFLLARPPDLVLGLPTTELLDSRAVRRAYRVRLERWADADEVEAFSEATDAVSVAFSRCRVPVVMLETDDEALVLRAMGHLASSPSPVSRRVASACREAKRHRRGRLIRSESQGLAMSRARSAQWDLLERGEGAAPDEMAALRHEVERFAERYERLSRAGRLMHRRRLADRARDLSERVASSGRHTGWVLYLMGRLDEIAGARRSAALHYRRAIDAWPREAGFHDALARVEARYGSRRDEDEDE